MIAPDSEQLKHRLRIQPPPLRKRAIRIRRSACLAEKFVSCSCFSWFRLVRGRAFQLTGNREQHFTAMLLPRKIFICFLAFAFFAKEASSQYKLEQPVLISKEHGLPTNDVRSIRKGRDGFVWMGTSEGLCRFDGQRVTIFRETRDAYIASFDKLVMTVLPRDKEIWMGTNQGVAVFNPADETFRYYQLGEHGKADSIKRRFDQAVPILFTDRQDDIWLGTKDRGIWLYDKERDDFKNFPYPSSAYRPLIPALGNQSSILSIEASRTNDSIIWAGTTAGLQEVNKYTGQVRWYNFPQENKDYQVAVNAFRRMYHHEDGLLYVGSWDAGVNVFDPIKKTFTSLILSGETGKNIFAGPIISIQRKSSDELWITALAGLAIYNTTQHRVTWHKVNKPLKSEFYGVDYIDDANRVWQTNIKGVQYFDPVVQQFTPYSFEHLFSEEWAYAFYILPDKDSRRITVCPRIADGIYIFDRETEEWTKSSFNGPIDRRRIVVRGFVPLSTGQYLVSADEGLFVYTLFTKKLTPAPNQPPVKFRQMGELLNTATNEVWLATDADGLVKWNLATGAHRIYKKELTTDGSGTGFGRLVHLYMDSQGNTWIGRAGGFSVHLAAKDSIIHFLYGHNAENSFPFVNAFSEDKNGKLWISSGDGWYGYLDTKQPEKGVIDKFDLKQSDINGFLTFLATDKQGNVWGYTNKELLRINADNLSLTRFSFEYGVKTPDFFHFSFLPSGEMVFGGRNGITISNPQELKRNTELPVPYIMQLKLLNQPVNQSLYEPGKELALSHRQNFISISFSAQAYTMPGGVKFRYRLKNFDDWTEEGGGRLANYTNIPPGDYVFQLQAANNEGVWNERMLELPITIATPWWQTWWFRITALVLIAALIYWLYQYRVNQVRKKEKMKSQYEKKLANVEMTALLAQMNPHFLFNSLNSIDSYIIKNESGKASEYLNNFARLMRLILQNSRSNYISLKDELEALDLYLQMEALRFKDKFSYEIRIDSDIDTAGIVIPPMLIQPYVENAIWHGLMHRRDGAVGKVEIIICRQDDNLVCIVQDNGIGREKAQQLKEQKQGSHKRSMGMQITKDRIDMINKLYDTNTRVQIIDLKDPQGEAAGTRVKLVIPV